LHKPAADELQYEWRVALNHDDTVYP